MNLIYYPLFGLVLILLVLGADPVKDGTTIQTLKNGCRLTNGISPTYVYNRE